MSLGPSYASNSGYLLRYRRLEGALHVAVIAKVAKCNTLCVVCASLQTLGESGDLYQIIIPSVVVGGTSDLQTNAVRGVDALVVWRARGLGRAGGA